MTEADIVAEIRLRFKKAQESVKMNAGKESFQAGFHLGYYDALGELLEFITDGE